MRDLTHTISGLCTLLEDAIEESDWDLAKTVSTELNELYEELDRSESNFENDY
jgi:hypothetical protein